MHKLLNIVNPLPIIAPTIARNDPIPLVHNNTFHNLHLTSMTTLNNINLMIFLHIVQLEYFVQIYQNYATCVRAYCGYEVVV